MTSLTTKFSEPELVNMERLESLLETRLARNLRPDQQKDCLICGNEIGSDNELAGKELCGKCAGAGE